MALVSDILTGAEGFRTDDEVVTGKSTRKNLDNNIDGNIPNQSSRRKTPKIKIGDRVEGNKLGLDDSEHKGVVSSIEKDKNNKVLYYEILTDKDKTKLKISPVGISKLNENFLIEKIKLFEDLNP